MAHLRLGDIAPNFNAETTEGKINFYEWLENNWVYYFLILPILHLFAQQN